MTPAMWLAAGAAHRPDQPALVTAAETLRFFDLFERARAVATGLVQGGVAAREGVALVDGASAVVADLLFATALLGCPAMPVEGARRGLIRSTGIPHVFENELPEPLSPTLLAGARSADDVQLVVATSGTTAEPKGVMLTAANIAAHVKAARARLKLEPGDVWLNYLPLTHVGGAMILYRCLEAGACAVLREGFDAERVAADIVRHRVTHISLVPPMLAGLVEVGLEPPPWLRHALVGGAALSAELAARAREAGWPIAPTYGMSETASQVATLAPWPEDWRPGLVGEPLEGLELAVDNRGRIRVKGDAVMAGYANPDRRFGEGLKDGWFETGDKGRLDPTGRLVVLGRVDEVLISGGHTIHPAEVEAALSACPNVVEAAVSGYPDPVWGDILVAVVVGEAEEAAVIDWCRRHLESPRRPRAVRKVASLPRTPLGKLDRAALRRLVTE